MNYATMKPAILTNNSQLNNQLNSMFTMGVPDPARGWYGAPGATAPAPAPPTKDGKARKPVTCSKCGQIKKGHVCTATDAVAKGSITTKTVTTTTTAGGKKTTVVTTTSTTKAAAATKVGKAAAPSKAPKRKMEAATKATANSKAPSMAAMRAALKEKGVKSTYSNADEYKAACRAAKIKLGDISTSGAKCLRVH
mmetsp:Transcript_41553/g.110810  ORF Transcript_41553/g.110810 Transcript_41553/m.110810 type:complete len:195 (+) Transcript_41553:367-951(+)